jgi:NADP-dependent alcohol dehydrogenase
MYQSIGVPTKLSAYKTDDKVVENIIKALESHGMTALGEKGNITLDKVTKILEISLK